MAAQTSVPRSRRSLLAAAAGGLAAFVAGAVGRPGRAEAAAGDPLILGQSNDSGTSQTILHNGGLGAAFTLKTTNTVAGAAGIFGWSSQTGADATRGVYGRADSPNSFGVQARNTASHGTGAALQAIGGNNTGVDASTANVGSAAVRGSNSSPAGTGINGVSNSGSGVHGQSSTGSGVSGTSGEGAGVSGTSALGNGVVGTGHINGLLGGSTGTGVRGNGEVGVYGIGDRGVLGTSSNPGGSGVYGEATDATGFVYGVYGVAESPNGFGVFSAGHAKVDGDLTVTGTLSKGAGAFKIDHPLDPANRYLSHSFVESPDMKNVYDGLVTLDARGEARVALPAYFETLNRDVRYQLTPLGAFSPLYVKSKVAKGRFRIAGGTAGQEVCWQVTGIRKDAFAEAHRIVVEEAKPVADRGLYLHPELYGQPATKGLDWQHRPGELRAAG